EFLTHARYFELLAKLTGRADLKTQRIPAGVLRGLGRAGDLAQRWLGKSTQLTSEAALVLTRSVPADDRDARALLGRDPTPIDVSLRDTISWMGATGVLRAAARRPPVSRPGTRSARVHLNGRQWALGIRSIPAGRTRRARDRS